MKRLKIILFSERINRFNEKDHVGYQIQFNEELKTKINQVWETFLNIMNLTPISASDSDNLPIPNSSVDSNEIFQGSDNLNSFLSPDKSVLCNYQLKSDFDSTLKLNNIFVNSKKFSKWYLEYFFNSLEYNQFAVKLITNSNKP
jgi:hypothetical protein